MSLLSTRNPSRAVILLVLAVFVVLFLAPVPSSVQKRIGGIGASTVWAGSPDETLNPPPTPPKRSSKLMKPLPGHVIGSRTFLGIAWRIYWATVRL